MSVKLSTGLSKTIVTPSQMKDGQIGEILKWATSTEPVGRIVQKYGERCLVVIGANYGKSFDTGGNLNDEEFQIRILQPGELIEIVNNG